MSFANLITEWPNVYDAARGEEAVAVIGATGPVADLLRGAAGSSPYLSGLIKREAEWLTAALTEDPDVSFHNLLPEYEGGDTRDAQSALRTMKRRGALLIALADLGGVWSLDRVTGALSDLADHAVDYAFQQSFTLERSGPLKGKDPVSAGLVGLAMGKGGARELNYSSDIDLILLFDEERYDDDEPFEVKARWTQVTRRVVKLLTEQTGEGYVFRTDLRLRPNPSVTPICMPVGAAERYYESIGRTWERAALIKARAAVGDIDEGEGFLDRIRPFIWRRHLDFAALEDINDIRARIRDAKGLAGLSDLPGYNLKLGPGGIREIEFFAQTQQLVLGGRNTTLRERRTVDALQALTDAGQMEADDCRALTDAYCAHRRLEHRFQMIDDAQTHDMPVGEAARDQVAALGGWSDRQAMENEVAARLADVRARAETFFQKSGGGRKSSEAAPEVNEMPFQRPDMVRKLTDRWSEGGIAATRDERARRKFQALTPVILEKLSSAGDPDDAVIQFDRFLSGLPAGVQLFSLFEANPQLLDLLAEICAAAPSLAEYLGRNARVLDAVLDASFFAPVPGHEALTAELETHLAVAGDYEAALDTTRRWAREKRFQLGVQVLRGVAGGREAGRGFSDIAQSCLSALMPWVEADFGRRHGPPPGRGAVIIGMGKLGSREMTASSDLDLIMVYDAGGATSSEGDKPLTISLYYARLTQKLVSALSALTAEGALYEVDMRLRPSGGQGPVAVSLESFDSYQHEKAWTWEHMALTRSKVVAGNASLAAEVEAIIADVLSMPREAGVVQADIAEMRGRLIKTHQDARDELWALKHGHGGLMDIEFVAQHGLLAEAVGRTLGPTEAITELVKRESLSQDDGMVLMQAYQLQSRLQQIERLAVSGAFRPETSGSGLKAVMARAGAAEDFGALEARLGEMRQAAGDIADRILVQMESQE
ncbi:MAG: bifunctional [glutamine synthetase] adenylyltransferase/[glutamine synthetase]-adenylyl-L-tyrosine phosphorylase [Pikeienuella sp.]